MHILLTTMLGLVPGVNSAGQAQGTNAGEQKVVIPQTMEVHTGGVGTEPLRVPLVHEVPVPFTWTPPTIDGNIDLGSEWAGAGKLYAGDTYGYIDGAPNDSGALIVYLMHDNNYIYIAYDCFGDNTFSNHSQPSVIFDDDNSHSYPPAPDTSEGGNGIGNDNGWKCIWFYQDNSSAGWYSYGGTDYAFGTGTGHYQFEIRIPIVSPANDLGPAFLKTGPAWPDTVGALIYWYDQVSPDYIKGWWPQDHHPDPWYACATFGDLILLPPTYNPYEISVPYASVVPTIDGSIGSGEWADAVSIDVSDTSGWDDHKNNPGDCILYAKHDNAFLYLAYDTPKDLNMADHSQPSISIDDNNSGDWPAPGNYSEGINGIGTSNGWWAMSRFNDGTYYGWYNTGRTDYAFGNSTGHVQCEFKIPIVSSDTKPEDLGAGPAWPDTIGVFIYYWDNAEPGTWIAGWPQVRSGHSSYYGWTQPDVFGDWILEPGTGVSDGSASPGVSLIAPAVVRGGFGITLSLPAETDLRLSLYDATGRLVSVIAEGRFEAGKHEFTANPSSGGVYILRADAGSHAVSQKVTVVK